MTRRSFRERLCLLDSLVAVVAILIAISSFPCPSFSQDGLELRRYLAMQRIAESNSVSPMVKETVTVFNPDTRSPLLSRRTSSVGTDRSFVHLTDPFNNTTLSLRDEQSGQLIHFLYEDIYPAPFSIVGEAASEVPTLGQGGLPFDLGGRVAITERRLIDGRPTEDGGTRRFLDPDPLGYVAGPNTYHYVTNFGGSPLLWTDSRGLDGEHLTADNYNASGYQGHQVVQDFGISDSWFSTLKVFGALMGFNPDLASAIHDTVDSDVTIWNSALRGSGAVLSLTGTGGALIKVGARAGLGIATIDATSEALGAAGDMTDNSYFTAASVIIGFATLDFDDQRLVRSILEQEGVTESTVARITKAKGDNLIAIHVDNLSGQLDDGTAGLFFRVAERPGVILVPTANKITPDMDEFTALLTRLENTDVGDTLAHEVAHQNYRLLSELYGLPKTPGEFVTHAAEFNYHSRVAKYLRKKYGAQIDRYADELEARGYRIYDDQISRYSRGELSRGQIIDHVNRYYDEERVLSALSGEANSIGMFINNVEGITNSAIRRVREPWRGISVVDDAGGAASRLWPAVGVGGGAVILLSHQESLGAGGVQTPEDLMALNENAAEVVTTTTTTSTIPTTTSSPPTTTTVPPTTTTASPTTTTTSTPTTTTTSTPTTTTTTTPTTTTTAAPTTTTTTTPTTTTTIGPLPAPDWVAASDGEFTGYVHIEWDAVPGATHYQVYRDTDSNVSGAQPQGWFAYPPGAGELVDGGPAVGTIYYYWVKAATSSTGANASPYSPYDTGFKRLAAPQNLIASNGTGPTVSLTWNAVPGANNYRVARSTVSGGPYPWLSDFITTNSYTDNTAVYGTNYYYIVAALIAPGVGWSDNSNEDVGWVTLGPPTSVSATKGNYTDKVRVTFNTVIGGTYYALFRDDDSNPSGSTNVTGWRAGTQSAQTVYQMTLDDTAVMPGQTHWFWVKAATSSSGANASGYSAIDWGWRALAAPAASIAAPPINSPTAAQGIFVLSQVSCGARYHRVLRNTTNNSGTASQYFGWTDTGPPESCPPQGLIYIDTGELGLDENSADWLTEAGQNYYYWFQAATDSFGTRASGLGPVASGQRLLTTPSNLSASDGTSTTEVTVYMTSVNGGHYLKVFRGTSSNPTTALAPGWFFLGHYDLAEIGPIYYHDTSAARDVTYYYRVKFARTSTGGFESAYSNQNTGWRD